MIAWAKSLWERVNGATDAKPKPAMTESQRLGEIGEKEAARFLAHERGMTILARNWRSPKDKRDEIDIVCRSPEGVIVFVEVKTYPTARLFGGYATVNAHKKSVLKRAAYAYLRGLGPRRYELTHRLDVVVVERADDGRLVPHHFVNVPLFSRGKHI